MAGIKLREAKKHIMQTHIFIAVLLLIALALFGLFTKNYRSTNAYPRYYSADRVEDRWGRVSEPSKEPAYIGVSDTWIPESIDKTMVKSIHFKLGFPEYTSVSEAEKYSAVLWNAAEERGQVVACCLEKSGDLNIYTGGADHILLTFDASCMFNGFSSATIINGLELLDTTETKYMDNMFADCSAVEVIKIPDNWDTSRVVDMSYMFFNCHNMKTLALDGLDMYAVEQTNYMIAYNESLTSISLKSWTESSLSCVSNRMQMFTEAGKNASELTIEISDANLETWLRGNKKEALKNAMLPEYASILLT